MFKRLLSTNIDMRYLHAALLIARVALACFMINHGIPKWNKFFSGDPIKFADPLGVGVVPSLALTIFAELFCSVFLLLGLFTRFAVFPLFITMLVAVFVVHKGDPFNKMEDAVLYLWMYFIMLFTGGGKYSIDYFLQKGKK
jgi:putative oxidoreductase